MVGLEAGVVVGQRLHRDVGEVGGKQLRHAGQVLRLGRIPAQRGMRGVADTVHHIRWSQPGAVACQRDDLTASMSNSHQGSAAVQACGRELSLNTPHFKIS